MVRKKVRLWAKGKSWSHQTKQSLHYQHAHLRLKILSSWSQSSSSPSSFLSRKRDQIVPVSEMVGSSESKESFHCHQTLKNLEAHSLWSMKSIIWIWETLQFLQKWYKIVEKREIEASAFCTSIFSHIRIKVSKNYKDCFKISPPPFLSSHV